ncbi:MAG: TolC family protein [Myxococcaceae bacterium]
MKLPAAAATCALLLVRPSHAAPCALLDTPQSVVACALAQSPNLRAAQAQVQLAEGQRLTASALFPSPPVLALTGADRATSTARDLNGSVTLSQEVSVAGQRGLKLDAAQADVRVEQAHLEQARRDVCARALVAWVKVLDARERLGLARETALVAERLRALAQARAQEQLVSALDARLAAAEAVRLSAEKFEADRADLSARQELMQVLGLDAPPTVPPQSRLKGEGIKLLEAAATSAQRQASAQFAGTAPLLRAAEASLSAAQSRLSLAHRKRVPSLTFSGFAQRDGFAERVLGVGVSAPLPLWPWQGGEVAQERARLEQARVESEQLRRQLSAARTQARVNLEAGEAELALFSAELISGARQDLTHLTQALSAGQLSLRDALLAQRSLIDLLQSERAVRLSVAVARVEWLHAAGFPFPGAQP